MLQECCSDSELLTLYLKKTLCFLYLKYFCSIYVNEVIDLEGGVNFVSDCELFIALII